MQGLYNPAPRLQPFGTQYNSIFVMGQLNTVLDQEHVKPSMELDDLSPLHILHVEDDEMIAVLIREMLEAQGWHVETCANGTCAMEKICSEAQYDLLLVDYKLPDLSGLELVHRARTLPHRSKTLIAVISANSVEAEAREAGADAFVSKPQGLLSLPDTIRGLLVKQQQSAL
jgi:CheY-like chemotaxis protein